MPMRDRYHTPVKNALIKAGWTVTHDPFSLKYGLKDMYIDLGAKQFIAAENKDRKIAVEIKSFLGLSELDDLEKALGQYILYLDVLAKVEPDRELFLAVNENVYYDLFEEPIGQLLINNGRLRLIVIDPQLEVIQRWIP